MLKAIWKGDDGKNLLLIGLSHRNLELLKDNNPIGIESKEIGDIRIDEIFIFSGETEAKMYDTIKQFVGAHTHKEIDPRTLNS